MKKVFRVLLLSGVLMTFLAVTALAASPTEAGIYNLKVETGYTDKVTVTPKTATDGEITVDSTAEIDKATVEFYAKAEKLTLTYSEATGGSQYLVLLLNDESGVPTEGNIAYIDQSGAGDSGVTFSIFPNKLESGKPYGIYLASNADSGITTLTKVATFQYYAPYTLGDVNGDGDIDTVDAMQAINHYLRNIELTGNRLLAADVNKDNEVDTVDAMRIINFYLRNIKEL